MRAKVVILVVLLAVVAASCGGGGDDDDTAAEESTPDATEEPTEEATEEPTEEATEAATAEPTEEPAADAEPLFWEFLEVGTCFNDPPGSSFDEGIDFDEVVEPVDCAEPHDNELYADGVYPADSDEFPGEDALSDYALQEICDPGYEAFMGVPVTEPIIRDFWIVPDEETWARGDRRLLCGVFEDELIGTATSAGLQAPELWVVHISRFDDQVDLYVSVEGEDPIQLTDDPEEEVINPPSVGSDGRVLYARSPLGDSTQSDILALSPDGEISEVLATSADEAAPRLSPDDSRIVYISDEGADEFDIWVMDADGSNRTRLSTNPDRDSSPSWSPDGTQIVYHARVDGESNIWIMNADGSDPRQITDDPAGDYDPVFSPDGTQIAFTSERAGNFDVWVMGADGSNPVNLTNHPAADEYPSWSPEGEGIAFTTDRVGRLIWIMRADGSDQTMFTYSGPSGYGTATAPIG